jgi:hypothetical protein
VACPAGFSCGSNGQCLCNNDAACGSGFKCDGPSGTCYTPCQGNNSGQCAGTDCCATSPAGAGYCDHYGN